MNLVQSAIRIVPYDYLPHILRTVAVVIDSRFILCVSKLESIQSPRKHPEEAVHLNVGGQPETRTRNGDVLNLGTAWKS